MTRATYIQNGYWPERLRRLTGSQPERPTHKYPVRAGQPQCGERTTCLGCPYARVTGCTKEAQDSET